MPLFAQLVSSLFGAAVGALFRLFGARVAARVLAVAAIAAVGTALLVAFNALVTPFASALFSTTYGQLLGLVFPPVSGTVLAGLVGFWILCALYRLKIRAIQVAASI